MLLGGGDHFETFLGGVGHGLFAVDILAGAAGVDDYSFVPEIGDGGYEAIDIFAGKNVLITAGDGEIRVAGDFAGVEMAAVIEVGGGYAFGSGNGDGGREGDWCLACRCR